MKEGPEPGNISFQWQLPPERGPWELPQGPARTCALPSSSWSHPRGAEFQDRLSSRSLLFPLAPFQVLCSRLYFDFSRLRSTSPYSASLEVLVNQVGRGAGITPVPAGVLALCLTSRQAGRRRKWQPIVQQHALLPGVSLGTEPSGAATSKGRTRPPPRGRCGGGG